ncbi:MAG: amidohydrolase family protein [Actinomycetota bacterium]
MSDLVIRNIGTIVTGDVASPVAEGDTIVVRDGAIASVGPAAEADTSGISVSIDAAGATVIPGLCDNHTHPVIGDYTPRQRQVDWIESSLHGGVTTMISAGEPHTPGRPTDPAGVRALTILAHASFDALRPAGVKVHAGAVLLEPGLTEDDFDAMADAGVRLVGEIGISGVKDADVAAEMTRWAQARGMKVMVHTGGASIPGSGVIGADFVVKVRPDVAGHTNGGPTALPLADVERILEETDAKVEIVHNGNVKAAGEVAALVKDRGEVGRLVVGTDAPAGSGVQPLGILRTISWAASLGGLDPALAVAAATGNVADLHGLPTGVLVPGKEADIAVVDAPLGSQARDALGALAIGDTIAVATAVVDGRVRFVKSRNTPPPVRPIAVEGSPTGSAGRPR